MVTLVPRFILCQELLLNLAQLFSFLFALFRANRSCSLDEFTDIDALPSLMTLVRNTLAFAFFRL